MDIGKLVGKPNKTQRIMSIDWHVIQVKLLFVCFVFEAESALIARIKIIKKKKTAQHKTISEQTSKGNSKYISNQLINNTR